MPTNAIGAPSLISKGDVTRALDNHRILRIQGYLGVHVLALSWEGCDVAFENDLSQVTLLFQESFNYDVYPYKIPSNRSQSKLNCHIANFIEEYGRDGNLIIVYYGGHGGYHKSKCEWAA